MHSNALLQAIGALVLTGLATCAFGPLVKAAKQAWARRKAGDNDVAWTTFQTPPLPPSTAGGKGVRRHSRKASVMAAVRVFNYAFTSAFHEKNWFWSSVLFLHLLLMAVLKSVVVWIQLRVRRQLLFLSAQRFERRLC